MTITGWMPTEQFQDAVGLDGPARDRVACGLLRLGQGQNDVHIAEIVTEPRLQLRQVAWA